jgi:hypothetical protein
MSRMVPGSVHHRRPPGHDDRDHRQVAIDRMHCAARGHILPVKITHEGVAADPLPAADGEDRRKAR